MLSWHAPPPAWGKGEGLKIFEKSFIEGQKLLLWWGVILLGGGTSNLEVKIKIA